MAATSYLFYLLVFAVLNSMALAGLSLVPNLQFPALYAFGDSIVDPGNNDYLVGTIIKSNFFPYGANFENGTATGRFCDGKIPTDILVEKLGIKDTLPAYLDPTLQNQDLVTGVSFASAGAGYDPLTSKLVSVLPLSSQISQFREYKEKLRSIVGDEHAAFIISNSLFIVVAGSDDIANTYFTLQARKTLYDIPSYTDFMVFHASNFLKELYEEGARRIGVLGMPPIGCVPSQRTFAGGCARNCSERANEAAKLFNLKLVSVLESLGSRLSGGRIVYLDIYLPLYDMIMNPERFGFQVSDRGCCGTGDLEVSILCNRLTPVTCGNISTHVFWDSYHPTEAAYRVIVNLLIKNYIIKFV